MTAPLLRMTLRTEPDIFVVRQRGREVAAALGLEHQDQVRVATALSEIGRELLTHGIPAAVTFEVRPGPTLAAVLSGRGVGKVRATDGAQAAARLLDAVESGDSVLVLVRRLPAPVAEERLVEVRRELAASRATTPLDELSVQNLQLVQALEEVQSHRDDLLRLNAELEETNRGVVALYGQLSEELEETNRGVVALYAELDERSAQLREASEAKSRFLANVSHELRAPVTAIIGLSRLLLDGGSDPLTGEQTYQMQLVQASAADLLARVNDLLDLAKAESNRIEPQWAPLDVRALFGQLRGTLRPMARPGVELLVDDGGVADLVSDELLVTQILRNLMTNALKFTEQGEVRLSAEAAGERVLFAVADTGIGIAPEEQQRVFEEFHQVRGAHQLGTTGTGLGLSYARRLAGLLGGMLTLRSDPGRGSVFTVDLPVRPPAVTPVPTRVLVVGDDGHRELLRAALAGLVDEVVEAADPASAGTAVDRERPDAIFLDAADLGDGTPFPGIPLVVVTADTEPPEPRVCEAAAVVLHRSEVTTGVLGTVLRALRDTDET